MHDKSIEQMIDNVIKEYGFEVNETLKFCSLCEKKDLNEIVRKYEKLMME